MSHLPRAVRHATIALDELRFLHQPDPPPMSRLAPRYVNRQAASLTMRIAAVSYDEIQRQLGWSDRQGVFFGNKPSDVAREINRYNSTQIEISDPKLAGERMGGTFSPIHESYHGRRPTMIPDSGHRSDGTPVLKLRRPGLATSPPEFRFPLRCGKVCRP